MNNKEKKVSDNKNIVNSVSDKSNTKYDYRDATESELKRALEYTLKKYDKTMRDLA